MGVGAEGLLSEPTGPLCPPCFHGHHDVCRTMVYDARVDHERLCGCWTRLPLTPRPPRRPRPKSLR